MRGNEMENSNIPPMLDDASVKPALVFDGDDGSDGTDDGSEDSDHPPIKQPTPAAISDDLGDTFVS
jgi:hypothetical protein